MFNWIKLCENEDSYDELRTELTSRRGAYILDNVKMPDTCDDAECTIVFKYYSDDRIVLVCEEAPLCYTGSDDQIRDWAVTGIKEFGSFTELESFLASFNSDRNLLRDIPHPFRRPPFSRPLPHIDFSDVDDDEEEPGGDRNGEPVPPPVKPEMRYDRNAVTVPKASSRSVVIDKDRLILELNSEIFGQKENILKIAHLVCNFLGTKRTTRPLSIFLYGPTGVGKTELVKALTDAINRQVGSKKAFAYNPVDCSQFQEPADINRLIGSPPGYVGFDEPGAFAILEDNPNVVFSFEEIEKAANNSTEVIMQALDTGRQATNGKTLKNGNNYYDLSHCIVFFTSNVELKEKRTLGFADPDAFDDRAVQPQELTNAEISRLIGNETKDAKIKLAETGRFRPEVVGRMNAVMRFNELSGDTIKDIAAKSINKLAEKEHLLYITELGTDIFQEFINRTADEVESQGARALRNEAANWFSEAFREFSNTHDDYTMIKVSGSLDNIVIEEDTSFRR